MREIQIARMRDTLIGRRVRLIHTPDPYTRLVPGTEGKVTFIDSVGTVFVDWDDGSSLGMVAGEDEYEVVS